MIEKQRPDEQPNQDEVPDGSGTDTDVDHTAESGDDDQFQG